MIGSTDLYYRLEAIARKPITLTAIPTHFSVILRLQRIIEDPDAGHRELARVLMAEPMVVARLVQAANAAMYIHMRPVKDLESAIFRLGSHTTRQIALAVMVSQLAQSKPLLRFASLSRHLWLHSLYTASVAAVLAEHYEFAKKDEALFAGLILNIGAFYLLCVATKEPGLEEHTIELKDWLLRHLLDTTQQLLVAMAMPVAIRESLDFELPVSYEYLEPPQDLQEALSLAFAMASERCPWSEDSIMTDVVSEHYSALWPAIEAQFKAIQAIFSN